MTRAESMEADGDEAVGVTVPFSDARVASLLDARFSA